MSSGSSARTSSVAAAAAAWLVFWLGPAAGAETLKNWFGDPYFPVRHAVPTCPVPRGPFISEADMRRQAHARAERGTACWLEGKCEKANAYHYDSAIAAAVERRFAANSVLPRSSLWVTVSRRIVWVEGCAPDRQAEARIRRLLRGLPDVEQVIVNVAADPRARSPYARAD